MQLTQLFSIRLESTSLFHVVLLLIPMQDRLDPGCLAFLQGAPGIQAYKGVHPG